MAHLSSPHGCRYMCLCICAQRIFPHILNMYTCLYNAQIHTYMHSYKCERHTQKENTFTNHKNIDSSIWLLHLFVCDILARSYKLLNIKLNFSRQYFLLFWGKQWSCEGFGYQYQWMSNTCSTSDLLCWSWTIFSDFKQKLY